MPEHLRALVVIIILATIVFIFARNSVCFVMQEHDFTRRRNLWFALTLLAFFSNNFWLYALICVPLLIYAKRQESNIPSLFFFIMFVLPVAYVTVPGMGLVNFIFDLSHLRILALVILLPAFLALRRDSGAHKFGRYWPDKALAAYLLLILIQHGLRESSFTDNMRQAFYMFIDIFLPYFVISRSLKNMQAFHDAILSLVLAIMVVALVSVFEAVRHWLLYQSVIVVLGMKEGMTASLGRDGMLRAIAATGQPIALGYLMAIGIGLYLFVQRFFQRNLFRRFGMLLLIGGSIASLSRGPWVGTAALFMFFIATGRYAVSRLVGIGLATIVAVTVIGVLPGGEKVINLLPFIGSTEKGNVEYREKLLTNSMIVIQRHTWFGSADYIKTPEMEELRQGQGIIDIVNSYIRVTLEVGVVGLGLFVGFFVLTLLGIYRAMRSIQDRDSEEYLLGRVLLATILSIMVIIFTTSSISIIPIMYWSVPALGVAYMHVVEISRDIFLRRLKKIDICC